MLGHPDEDEEIQASGEVDVAVCKPTPPDRSSSVQISTRQRLVGAVVKKFSVIQQKVTTGHLDRLAEDVLQQTLKQMERVVKLLKMTTETPKNLVQVPELDHNHRTIPRVIEQYSFHKKKKRVFRNVSSVSILDDETNRLMT